jgi:hypothetical protein
VGKPGTCPGGQSILCWFNPGAYAIPSVAPGQLFATNFGNAGVGTLRGPAQYNVDASIFKDFAVRESMSIQFRAEAFNVFNHPQFGIPNADVDTSQAGQISTTVHSSRQLQFGFKFLF